MVRNGALSIEEKRPRWAQLTAQQRASIQRFDQMPDMADELLPNHPAPSFAFFVRRFATEAAASGALKA